MIRILLTLLLLFPLAAQARQARQERELICTLTSTDGHGGNFAWQMKRADEVRIPAEQIASERIDTRDWMPAVVPGTVLNSLVYNGVYPEPYYGLNNKIESGLIPDISKTGRDFYTYWFRQQYHVKKWENHPTEDPTALL